MKTLNEQDLALLSILGYPELFRVTLKLQSKNQVVPFPEMGCAHLNIMYTEALRLAREHREYVRQGFDIETLVARLSSVLEAENLMFPELREKCDLILWRLRMKDLPELEEARSCVNKLIGKAVGNKIGNELLTNPSLANLERIANAAKGITADLTSSEAPPVDNVVCRPFRDMKRYAVHMPRVPTGINWMDELTSGGGRDQELWLILGPSAGGKTVSTVQYACAQALMGNGVVWATYEQSLVGDIAERIIACTTGYSLSNIRDVGYENLSPAIREKFESCCDADKYMRVLDMTVAKPSDEDIEDYGGVYSVWKRYKQLKAEEGFHAKTVIIDWVGAMMSKVAASLNADLTKGFRFYTQHEIDIARKMAKEENIMVIFLHQTNTECQEARPSRIPDMTCAKDMRDMGHYMDIVLTLGKRDKHNIFYVSSAKSRKGNPITKTVELKGEFAKIVPAPGWQINRDGNFYKPGESYLDDTKAKDADGQYSNETFSREID